MEHVLVRYSEIGTKSRPVQERMLGLLCRRVAERLDFEGVDDAEVGRIHGRIVARTADARRAAEAAAELPGVRSASPALRTDATIDAIEAATDAFEVGPTFGVRTNRSGDHPFTSQEVDEAVGTCVEERTGADVDLTDPATWIEVDVRDDDAYVFTTRLDGPGGFPVGSQAPVAALISGGIDSPVAAHAVMTRGSDVVPVYCYNRPFAAGDHRVRFESALSKLARVHPAKEWYYHCVDMEAVNDALADVGRGRMLLHRIVMFRVAGRIAGREDLAGIVTGESIGQKSSQTAANLEHTSAAVSKPVFRPLLTVPKERIVERARRIGTFEDAVVDSACRTIAPDHPASAIGPDRLAELERRVGIDDLVDRAHEDTERVELG